MDCIVAEEQQAAATRKQFANPQCLCTSQVCLSSVWRVCSDLQVTLPLEHAGSDDHDVEDWSTRMAAALEVARPGRMQRLGTWCISYISPAGNTAASQNFTRPILRSSKNFGMLGSSRLFALFPLDDSMRTLIQWEGKYVFPEGIYTVSLQSIQQCILFYGI